MITKKDIEFFGFDFVGIKECKLYFINDQDYRIYFDEEKGYIAIESNASEFYFKGYLQTIDELVTVLKQTRVL